MAFLRSRLRRIVAVALLTMLLAVILLIVSGWGRQTSAPHGVSFGVRFGDTLSAAWHRVRGNPTADQDRKGRIDTVARSDITAAVRASGQLRPVREVEVGTLATGQLNRLAVTLGQHVVRGQLLATIDPSLADNAVRRERARLAEASAQRDAARIQLALLAKKRTRAQRLRSSDAGSEQDVEQADADWARQRALLAERNAALVRARILLDDAITEKARTRIVAPIDGEVTAIKIFEGQTVVATQTAQVILTLSDVTQMTVAAHVSEADIDQVEVGQPVTFSVLAAPNRPLTGVIREIEPTPVKKTGDASRAIYYQALFDVDNAAGTLRPMMTADIDIVARQASDVLTIPLMALLPPDEEQRAAGTGTDVARDAERGHVYVIERDGSRRRQAVTLGIRSDARVEVRTGLSEGDTIVADAGWRG